MGCGVGNNQAYLGRAYATLRNHKSSLGSLSQEEWHDFENVVQRLEEAYMAVYGAEPLNWSCCMNFAFREEPFNPHVHWHIYPRYKNAPEINGVTYEDVQFGNMYNDEAERLVYDNTAETIAYKLREYLENN